MRLRFRGGTGGRASREGGPGDAPRELEMADLLPVICLLGVIAAVVSDARGAERARGGG